MKPKITRVRLPAITCPHCNTRSIVRTSEKVTATYRELRLRCENDECGWSGVAAISIIRTIVPSARPNPEVHLPFSKAGPVLPKTKPANDDMPIPANDVEPLPAPCDAMIAPG
ncbi:MAG: hypothetical protein JWM38_2641 [Sphingomonas bacterium]|jgi:hypothetical protein|nr:hypothetical protein [Sphingomonas bacterium]MDB5683561.1 hypothetical protein [Sphingomonas bacterium]MDB5719214.1 hypothetical protein [Sphingomonas bacterium]